MVKKQTRRPDRPNKKLRIQRYHLEETGTKFQLGTTFSPSRRDLVVVLRKMDKLGIIAALEPVVSVEEAIGNDAASRYLIKDLLESAAYKEYETNVEPAVVLGLLWVLACYNYRWYDGPIPSSPPRRKYPRRTHVTSFRCPYCGREFLPNPRYKSRIVILKQFSRWLVKHADANYIYLSGGVS